MIGKSLIERRIARLSVHGQGLMIQVKVKSSVEPLS